MGDGWQPIEQCPNCGLLSLTPWRLAEHMSHPRTNLPLSRREAYRTEGGNIWVMDLGDVPDQVVAEAENRGLIKRRWPKKPEIESWWIPPQDTDTGQDER